MSARQRYRQQREPILNVTFDAFFLIAGSSLATTRAEPAVRYSTHIPLPAPLSIPDRAGRDVLLAGLLSTSEQQWHIHLATLLCAAIVEGRSKPALDLLRQWAEIVVRQQGDEAEMVYTVFVKFMAYLGHMVREWCQDLDNHALNRSLAPEVYENKLTSWRGTDPEQKHCIAILVQDVIRLLHR
jgi:hypothetical protein